MFGRAIAVVVVLAFSSAAAADDARIVEARAVVESFYRSLAAHDFESAGKLWSAAAPTRAARLRELRSLVARSGGPTEVRSLEIATEHADQGSVDFSLTVSLMSHAPQGERPVFAVERSRRRMQLKREGDAWRIVAEQSLADELAAAVAAATTDEEQARLVAARPDLMTAELPSALARAGVAVRTRGQYPAALRLSTMALRLADDLGDTAGKSMALSEIGAVAFSRSDYDTALRNYDEALKLRAAANDPGNLAVSQSNIGLVHRFTGDLDGALEFFAQALKNARSVNDDEVIASIMTSIGAVRLRQGDYAEAVRTFKGSLEIQEKLGNTDRAAIALNSLGNAFRLQGNNSAGRDSYDKSLSLYRAISDKAGTASVLNNLGTLALDEGDPDASLDLLQRALILKQELGDKSGVALVQMHMGELAVRSHHFQEARCWFATSRTAFETLGARADYAELLLNEASLSWEEGHWNDVLATASTAAEEARAFGRKEQEWRAETLAGRALVRLNRRIEARHEFEDAVGTIEALRTNIVGEEESSLYFQQVVDPYHALMKLAVDRGDFADAFRWSELARGRVLLDALRYGHAAAQPIASSDKEGERRLIRVLAKTNADLSRERNRSGKGSDKLHQLVDGQEHARAALADFRRNLLDANPELRRRHGQVQPITLDQASDVVGPHSAVIEYAVTTDGVFALFLRRGGGHARLTVKRLPIDAAELTRRAERVHFQMSQRDLGFRTGARDLYRLLLAPFAESLRSVTRLAIVPDGPLWRVPFQALIDGKGHFLIESVEVSYAPSMAVMREMNKGERRGEAEGSLIAAFGQGPPESVRNEVETLQTIYGSENARIFVGPSAQVTSVKQELGSTRIVHIAAHGFFDDRSPMHSFVQLAPDAANDDGVLEAWELLDVRAAAQLTVLSGCETGRGRATSGEGLIGMSWALFVAGCPTTVASLWPVEAASTRELMTRFHRHLYQGLRGGSLAPASALRAAALELIRSDPYRHPFHWAAFVVMGRGI